MQPQRLLNYLGEATSSLFVPKRCFADLSFSSFLHLSCFFLFLESFDLLSSKFEDIPCREPILADSTQEI